MDLPTKRQSALLWLPLTGLAIATLVALVVALVWGLGHVLHILGPVLWPLAVAGVLAYLLDPVVDFIEHRGASRPQAILCVFAFALAIMTAMGARVVPQIITETRQLAARIPAYASRVEQRLEHWVNNPPALLRKLLER